MFNFTEFIYPRNATTHRLCVINYTAFLQIPTTKGHLNGFFFIPYQKTSARVQLKMKATLKATKLQLGLLVFVCGWNGAVISLVRVQRHNIIIYKLIERADVVLIT